MEKNHRCIEHGTNNRKAKVVMFDGTAKAIEGNTDAFIPPIPKPKMAMTLPIRMINQKYFPDMLVKVKEWF